MKLLVKPPYHGTAKHWHHLKQPDLAKVVRNHPSVQVGMAGSVSLREMIEDLVRVAGAERVVFAPGSPDHRGRPSAQTELPRVPAHCT